MKKQKKEGGSLKVKFQSDDKDSKSTFDFKSNILDSNTDYSSPSAICPRTSAFFHPLPQLKAYLEVRRDGIKLLKCSNKSHQCGNACVPKNKKCILSDTQLERIVMRYEDKIKDLPHEQGIVIDSQGRVLVNKKGDRTSIDFTAEEVEKMRGAIVTHNHPNLGWGKGDARSKGLSFSKADVYAACIAQMKEVRAVSSGYRHSLKPPKAGFNEQFWGKVEPVYSKHERQVYTSFASQILTGRMRIDVAEGEYHHEVISRTAKELGMFYKRENI